jgi:hypothetical protein
MRNRKNPIIAQTIAHAGMLVVVTDPSVTVQETSPRGRVPLGVNTRDPVTEMSPIVTRTGSVGA